MRVRAALWKRGPVLFFHAADLPELEERGVGVNGGKKFPLALTATSIQGMPSAHGPALHAAPPEQVMLGWEYRVQEYNSEVAELQCHLFEAEGTWDGLRLVVPLPRVEDLPWPMIHYTAEAERAAFARRQVAIRRRLCAHDSGRLLHIPEKFGAYL